MDKPLMDKVLNLRSRLHGLAELSGEETRTKECLMAFLRENTSLRLEDRGKWFCAFHEEPYAKETIAFRGDMDAIPFNGGAAHLCGHDGHCAVLAGLGLMLENKKLGRNIVLVFQHAEEIGAGGRECSEGLEKYPVDRIYAFHNIPGWEEGAVLLRRDTFACASLGMTLTLTGAPSHAAYPENGRNPGFAASRLINDLPVLANRKNFKGMTMATLVGAKIGTKTFGSSAGTAEIWLTLRAWYDNDLKNLITAIEAYAKKEGESDGLSIAFSYWDSFPSTLNDNETVRNMEKICNCIGLKCIDVPEPFRWSEDFGYYGARAKAVMVGVGAGENWPQLHTSTYAFNDKILSAGLTLFYALAQMG